MYFCQSWKEKKMNNRDIHKPIPRLLNLFNRNRGTMIYVSGGVVCEWIIWHV